MGIGPVAAIPRALANAGLTLDQIDLVEINEAFASQVLASARELGIDEERLNVNGGAIALGHPLGCSGARLTGTLVRELRRRGGKLRRRHPLRRRRPGPGDRLRSRLNARLRAAGRLADRRRQGRLAERFGGALGWQLPCCSPLARRPRPRRCGRRPGLDHRRRTSATIERLPLARLHRGRRKPKKRLRLHRHGDRAAGGPHRRPLRRGPRDRRRFTAAGDYASRPAAPTRRRRSTEQRPRGERDPRLPRLRPRHAHSDAALLILSAPDHGAADCRSRRRRRRALRGRRGGRSWPAGA